MNKTASRDITIIPTEGKKSTFPSKIMNPGLDQPWDEILRQAAKNHLGKTK